MDEELLELHLQQAIADVTYQVEMTIIDTFSQMALGKTNAELVELPNEEQIKLLDKEVKVGKVYELLSTFLTKALNNKIKIDSALKATETEGKKNGK